MIRPPRIAVLVKRFPRLSETFVLNEILELRRQGVDLHLFALMDPQERLVHPEAARLVPEVTYIHEARRSLGSWWRLLRGAMRQALARPLGTFRVLWALVSVHRSLPSLRHAIEGLWLAGDMRRRGITHLHAHFIHSPGAVAFFAQLAGGPPFSITAHAKDLYTTLPRNLRIRGDAADFLVTCTAANRAYIEAILGKKSAHRVHVAYHGTDLIRFNPYERSPEPGRIVSVGRLVPKKGFADLLKALELLAGRGVEFRCDVYGGGPLREQLDDQVRQAGLVDRIRLHGARLQPELIAAYQRATLFVLAPVMTEDGDRDGIPNVLVEAMACGLPVVSTRLSGIPELIDDGVNGLLVAPGDPNAIAAAIERLLTDASLSQALGPACRRKVEAFFDLSRNTQQLAEWLGAGTVPSPSSGRVREGVTVA